MKNFLLSFKIGWKGLECQLKHDECEVADCNGHGKCVNGNCLCARGFTGPSCEQSKFKHSYQKSLLFSHYSTLFHFVTLVNCLDKILYLIYEIINT